MPLSAETLEIQVEKAREAGNIIGSYGVSKDSFIGDFLKNGTWKEGDLGNTVLIDFLWLGGCISRFTKPKRHIFINCTFRVRHQTIYKRSYFINCKIENSSLVFDNIYDVLFLYNCSIDNSYIHSSTGETYGLCYVEMCEARNSTFSSGTKLNNVYASNCKLTYSKVLESNLINSDIRQSNINKSDLFNCTIASTQINRSHTKSGILFSCLVENSVCEKIDSTDCDHKNVVWINGTFGVGKWYAGIWRGGVWEQGYIKLLVSGKSVHKSSELVFSKISPIELIKVLRKEGIIVKLEPLVNEYDTFSSTIIVILTPKTREKFREIIKSIG